MKVSVGEPYFNRMAVPICFSLLLLMGIGPALPWGRASKAEIRRALVTPLPAALAGLAIAALFGARSPSMLLTGALGGYALWVTVAQALRPTRTRRAKGESAATAFRESTRRAPRVLGAYTVHFGVIMTFVAIAISSSYQRSGEATLTPGESLQVGSYRLTLEDVGMVQRPHMASQVASIRIEQRDRDVGSLAPSVNFYPSQREPIGTPAVRTTLGHDLYLTLQSVGNGGEAGLRAIVTPAVLWIWIGVGLMTVGTVLCLIPPRGAVRAAAAAEPPMAA